MPDTFDKVHELAAPRNLRTIAVQRREYPGSTPYTNQELDDMIHGRQALMDDTAVLMAQFIQYLARDLKVPKITDGRLDSGIALLGWSVAAGTALAPLSDPDLLSQDLKKTLDDYLRQVIIFGKSHPDMKATMLLTFSRCSSLRARVPPSGGPNLPNNSRTVPISRSVLQRFQKCSQCLLRNSCRLGWRH